MCRFSIAQLVGSADDSFPISVSGIEFGVVGFGDPHELQNAPLFNVPHFKQAHFGVAFALTALARRCSSALRFWLASTAKTMKPTKGVKNNDIKNIDQKLSPCFLAYRPMPRGMQI